MHTLYWFLSIAVITYLIYMGALYGMQRRLIFRGTRLTPPSEPVLNHPRLEKVWFQATDAKVETWFLAADGAAAEQPRPTMIFLHGNFEVIDEWPNQLTSFLDVGISLMLVEYPGYGRSQGSPSQAVMREIMMQVYDYLCQRADVDTSRLVLYGRSLGGGVACDLIQYCDVAAMILEATFVSIRSYAAGYLAPGFLVRDPFDNIDVIKNYQQPVLIIHGKHDQTVPIKHGQALYEAAPHAEMMVLDCGHNDCPRNNETYLKGIIEFLRKAAIISPATVGRS